MVLKGYNYYIWCTQMIETFIDGIIIFITLIA